MELPFPSPCFLPLALLCFDRRTEVVIEMLLRLLASVALAGAQFIPAPIDLKSVKGYANTTVRYKQVPTGICELDPAVKSYSGYVDVA